jgi:hypothetical protein
MKWPIKPLLTAVLGFSSLHFKNFPIPDISEPHFQEVPPTTPLLWYKFPVFSDFAECLT